MFRKIKISAAKIAAFISLLLLALMFSGCGSAVKQAAVRETEYVYLYSPLADSLTGTGDSVVSFQKVIEHDTLWEAKYYTKYKTLKIRAPTDTIRINTPRDTVEKLVKEYIETPFLSKAGLVLIGILIGAGVLLVIKFIK